jgi:hypothetical protein
MSADKDRQFRIAWIKDRELHKFSFLEIVNAYNATFGTNHFAEVLGNPQLAVKKDTKQFGRDLQDIFLGDGFLNF